MQYYKNSMRYVKFLLVSVVLFAIYITFLQDKVMNMITSRQDAKLIEQQMLQQQMEEEQQTPKEETEAEFVDRMFKEYKEKHPNISIEKEIEIQDTLRNEYRITHNQTPVEIRYAPESINNTPSEPPVVVDEPQQEPPQNIPQEPVQDVPQEIPPQDIPQEPIQDVPQDMPPQDMPNQ
ncbi:MAG: hypothetical protein IJ877_04765 [Candidatus Gastranaerophilales bacterium]|nr:hypothetical protein [Candidatus Gastranaerophilales bacterium]